MLHTPDAGPEAGSTFEVEMKFRVADAAELRRRLAVAGFVAGDPIDQEDVYFQHPCRDLALTGEAFRVRRDGPENRITYKGPRRPGPTKTREEIEIGFASGTAAGRDLAALLERLGFQAVAAVRKTRTPHTRPIGETAILILLDEVEALGTFVEVEALAGGESDLAGAQSRVQEVAARIGLGEAQHEPRSYLRMLLEERAKSAGTP